MSTASPQNQELARRLIVFEAGRANSSDAPVDVAVLVIGELRLRLIKLAGVDGFRSLLSRALTLAKAEVPLLNMVQIRSDGSVEGFNGTEVSEEAGALTAYVSEENRIRVLRSGFQIHVPKPISPSELIAVVANLAGRTVQG